jgi:hypothetical protein
MAFFDTSAVGAIVLEIPPAGENTIVGSIMDSWQIALEDLGPAGRPSRVNTEQVGSRSARRMSVEAHLPPLQGCEGSVQSRPGGYRGETDRGDAACAGALNSIRAVSGCLKWPPSSIAEHRRMATCRLRVMRATQGGQCRASAKAGA